MLELFLSKQSETNYLPDLDIPINRVFFFTKNGFFLVIKQFTDLDIKLLLIQGNQLGTKPYPLHGN